MNLSMTLDWIPNLICTITVWPERFRIQNNKITVLTSHAAQTIFKCIVYSGMTFIFRTETKGYYFGVDAFICILPKRIIDQDSLSRTTDSSPTVRVVRRNLLWQKFFPIHDHRFGVVMAMGSLTVTYSPVHNVTSLFWWIFCNLVNENGVHRVRRCAWVISKRSRVWGRIFYLPPSTGRYL